MAGSGKGGFEGDGGPALEAEFNNIGGMAVDGRGTLYVGGSAYLDNAVRKGRPGGDHHERGRPRRAAVQR